MGVKGLWSVLEPVGEQCPLSELAGRTVAVDLSGWVVEAETAQALASAISQPYLRNLVYRTSALLLQHTVPVFVLDGAAPQLKLAEMARRQGGAAIGGGRQQLRGRLRRCARLLDCLGVPYVTADGEAEALCARLDSDRLVDGVVSDDVDAALQGARTLYRRLTATQTGGEVTRYSMRRVRDELGLGTQQLTELALLLGCDFLPAGLPGLGLQVAQQLVRRLDGRPLLPELARWLRDPPLCDMPAVGELGRGPSHCVRCAHPGTETRHRKDGCGTCGSGTGCTPADTKEVVCQCDWHRQRRDAEKHIAELKARDCARRTPDYEASAAAAERELTRPAPLPTSYDLTWKRPHLSQFTAEAGELLGWTPEQCLKISTPLLARWQLRHSSSAGGDGDATPLRPVQVMRTSKRHHIDCYLVRWQLDANLEPIETHEPRPLVETAHPTLVQAYFDTKKKPKRAPARQPRKTKASGGTAGPQAKIGTGSPSKLITDFFQIRKKGTDQSGGSAAGSAAAAAAKNDGPPSAAAPAESSSAAPSTPSPEPSVTPGARRVTAARHDISPESPESVRRRSAEDSPCASGDSSSDSESYAGSDGSVADLSAIIDAITRTRISDDAVIVISDDDDVLEVSESEPSRPRCDGGAPSGDVTAAGGAVVVPRTLKVAPRSPSGKDTATADSDDRAATLEGDAEAGSDSDSDVEYVPLCRRLEFK